jgi:nucleolar protein 56
MKVTILESIFGVLGFDETSDLVDWALFPKDSTKVAEKLLDIEAGKVVDELAALIDRLKEKGYTFFMFENAEIARNSHERFSVAVEVVRPSLAGESFRANLEKYAVQTGFVEEAEDFRDWMHQVSVELTKLRVRKATAKRDLLAVQAIQTIDDLDRTINLFMGRMREWYGLHFPELDRLVEKHETYARLIIDLGEREKFTVDSLERAGLPKTRAEQIADIAQKSMGADLYENDLTQIQMLCRDTLQLFDARQSLEGYMDSLMEEVAPNVKALVGSLLGARLVALVGGLDNLAKMPSSTIQVLGAEKALFRSLKTGTRPPKHGIIFQHALIHDAKRWQRGKMARAIAGKLAIAARTDAFSGKYIGDGLKAGLERRIQEIQEKYKEPPPPKQPTKQSTPQRPYPRKSYPRRMKRGRRR